MEFNEIFNRHFFSNHHVEAKQLEETLEKAFEGYDCVSFSSVLGLVSAIYDEIITDDDIFYVYENEKILINLERFLSATNRKMRIKTLPSSSRKLSILACDKDNAYFNDYIFGGVVMNNKVIFVILDFSKISVWLRSAAFFITQDSELSEKIRWSRSSYGRRTKSFVNIAANGRFSEFQACLINESISL